MSTGVAIPEPEVDGTGRVTTTPEQIAPGALSPYAAELVPTYRRAAGLPDRQEWTTLAGMANTLAESGMLPKGLVGRPAALMAIFLKGRDLGLSPTESLWGIDMIEGMPTLKAHTMSALIRRAGHRLWYAETNRERAVICAERLERWRGDGEPVYGPTIRVEWTIEDAIDAKLVSRNGEGKLVALSSQGNKPKPWMLYPAAMLRARALTAIARMEFSDVLMGAWYSPEELGAEVDGDGKVIRLPRPAEAVAAFEQTMERRSQHTGGDQAREPDEVQSARPPESAIRDGEELSDMVHPNAPTVIDAQVEPPPPPPSREELWAELEEQARVLAGGSLARHTARAVAAYKANSDQWDDEQLIEFVTGRRQSYVRHLEEHPDLAPATPEPWKAAAPAEEPTDEGVVKPPEPEPADEPAPEGTEPADDPAPEGTEPADAIEDPPEGMDTLV